MNVDKRVIQPALRIGVDRERGRGEQRLFVGRNADEPGLGARGLADNDLVDLRGRDHGDPGAGGFRRGRVLDPELRVVGRIAGLLLDDVERAEIQQELADLARIGRVVALADHPVRRRLSSGSCGSRSPLVRRISVTVERVLESRQHEIARLRGTLEVPLRGQPDRKGNDDDSCPEQE